MAARISQFIFDNGEYYAAHLDNGGVRVGMNSYCHLEVPSSHPLYSEAVELTLDTIEAFIDAQIEAGRIRI